MPNTAVRRKSCRDLVREDIDELANKRSDWVAGGLEGRQRLGGITPFTSALRLGSFWVCPTVGSRVNLYNRDNHADLLNLTAF